MLANFDEKRESGSDNKQQEHSKPNIEKSLNSSTITARKDDLGALLQIATLLKEGNTEIILQVLKLDTDEAININATLMMAISCKNGEVARYLIDKGATNLPVALVALQKKAWFGETYSHLIDKIIEAAKKGSGLEEIEKLQEAAVYIIQSKQYDQEKLLAEPNVIKHLDNSILFFEALKVGNGFLVDVLLQNDKTAVWTHVPSALAMMQGFTTKLGWRTGNTYDDTYNKLIHILELKTSQARANTPPVADKNKLVECLKYIIHNSPKDAITLLTTHYIRKQCDLNALLMESLKSKEKENALITLLVEDSDTAKVTSILAYKTENENMDQESQEREFEKNDKENKKEEEVVKFEANNILEVIDFMQTSVARVGWRIGSSYNETYFYLINSLKKKAKDLKKEKLLLKKVLLYMVKSIAPHEGDLPNLLLSAQNVQDCLEKEDMRDLLLEALQVGNGEIVKKLMDNSNLQGFLPSALVLMQSFKTSWGWKTGSYQDTYEYLIDKLTKSSLVFSPAEKDNLMQCIKRMIIHADPKRIQMLGNASIRKQLYLNVLCYEALKCQDVEIIRLLVSHVEEDKNLDILEIVLDMQSEAIFKIWNVQDYYKTYFYLFENLQTKPNTLMPLSNNKDKLIFNLKAILCKMSISCNPDERVWISKLLAAAHIMNYFGDSVNDWLSELNQQNNDFLLLIVAKVVKENLLNEINKEVLAKRFSTHVQRCNIDLVLEYFDNFYDVLAWRVHNFSALMKSKHSPLFLAIEHGKIEKVSSFLTGKFKDISFDCVMVYEKAMQVKKENSTKMIPFYKIPEITYSDLKILKLKYINSLLDIVKSSNTLTNQNRECLKEIFFSSIYQGETDVFSALLPLWISLSKQEEETFGLTQKEEKSPLVIAIKCGKPEIVSLFLKEKDIEYDYIAGYQAAKEVKARNNIKTMIPMPEISKEDFEKLKQACEKQVQEKMNIKQVKIEAPV